MIIILDFGSQYTHMIARRVRSLGCFSLVLPWDSTLEDIERLNPKGIILSGGPSSIHLNGAKNIDANIFSLELPILGICYGMQIIASHFGGVVSSQQHSEYGRSALEVKQPSVLFENVILDDNDSIDVWMSHGDSVETLPQGFKTIARTDNCKCSGLANDKMKIYGLQFHPEVNNTNQGQKILANFIYNVCLITKEWNSESITETIVQKAKETLGEEQVLLALSGGVDSMVLAYVLKAAIPSKNLHCVLVDHGLLRTNEVEQIQNVCLNADINIDVIDAKDNFFKYLKGITEPEQKRKIIGRLFIEEFEYYARDKSDITWLAQGTIYPDVIESAGDKNGAQVIKSHHNVGGLPEKLGFKVIEPFRDLYKDEVRAIGRELSIDTNIINRHPFPGPGLAIRILGEVTKEKVVLIQAADKIWLEELWNNDLYNKMSQAFAVLLPINTVGVIGDKRHYGPVVALRSVVTDDFMTATWASISHDVLDKAARRIMNEVPTVSRVVYDISSKPPATIEWE